MDTVLAIISPLGRGRRYGAVAASFLLLVVLAEIEGLAFLLFALVLGNPGLFLTVQSGLFPAALFVAAATAGAMLWRASRWEVVHKLEALRQEELAASFVTSDWQERIGTTRRT